MPFDPSTAKAVRPSGDAAPASGFDPSTARAVDPKKIGPDDVDLGVGDIARGIGAGVLSGTATAAEASTAGVVDSMQRIAQDIADRIGDPKPFEIPIQGPRSILPTADGGAGREPKTLEIPNPVGSAVASIKDATGFDDLEREAMQRGINPAQAALRDSPLYEATAGKVFDAASAVAEGIKTPRWKLAEQAFSRDLQATENLPAMEQAAAVVDIMRRHPAVTTGVLAESAPSMVASIATGRAVLSAGTKIIQRQALQSGMSPAVAAAIGRTWARGRGATLATGAIVGNAVAQSVASTADEVADAIRATPDADLMAASPRYRDARRYATEDEVKRVMAIDAANAAAGQDVLTSGLSNLLTAGFEAKIAAGAAAARHAGSKAAAVARGVAEGIGREGAQEAFESGGERLARNVGTIDSGADPDLDPTTGVAGEATLGGAMGAVMGGGAGVVSGIQDAAAPEPARSDSTNRQSTDQDTRGSEPGQDTGKEADADVRPEEENARNSPEPRTGNDDEIGAAFEGIEGQDENREAASGGAAGGNSDAEGGIGDLPPAPGSESGPGQPETGAEATDGRVQEVQPVRGEASQHGTALDQAAHEAATSPHNERPEPSQAQKEAGNYKKGHIKLQGLDISIENPAGSRRRPEWEPLQDHYGYVIGTKGSDKEHIDAFIGPNHDSQTAYVVDQIDPKTGRFDEHKIILGATSERQARQIYRRNYQPGWRGLGAVTGLPIDELKTWLQKPQTKPIGELKPARVVDDARIDRPEVRGSLEAMAQEAGWAEIGGRLLRTGSGANAEDAAAGRAGESGDVVGRTKWTPRAPWFAGIQRDARLPGNADGTATREAVRKALDGEQMTAAERRHVIAMLDQIDADEQDAAARAAARPDEPIELDDVEAAGLDPSSEDDVLDLSLLARIAEQDEDGFERAAIRYENDDAGLMAWAKEWVDGRQAERSSRAQPRPEADRRSEGGGAEAQSRTEPGQRGQREPTQGQVGGEVGPGLELEAQTESDLTRRDQQRRDSNKREADQRKRADQKASADQERDAFVLTGSGRDADQAMARGQRDLLSSAEQRTEAQIDIEKFGDKMIVVRDDTDAHRDRIKAIPGAFFNSKANGWTFKAQREPEIREVLADLVGPARQITDVEQGRDRLESPEVSDAEPKNPAESEPVRAGDGAEDRSNGRAGESDRRPLGQRMGEADEEAGDRGQTSGRADGTGRGRTKGTGSRSAEPVDRGNRKPADRRDRQRPAGIVDEPPGDHVITDTDDIGAGGEKTKARQNIAAIELVKRLAEEGRSATAEERKVLARYVGWGGIKSVFDPHNPRWADEHLRLKKLLTEEEYAAARASILDAHFTSIPVVDAIWGAAQHFGFDGGLVLEPALGTGNFFGRVPDDLAARVTLNGVELDRITGMIAAQLYQRASIASPVGFQDVTYPADSVDLVIGNPPFGSQKMFDPKMPELKGFSIHNFFFAKSVAVTRPGGLVTMVVSHSMLDAKDARARRWIADRAHLLGAVRLPYTAFLSNAGTEVVTDILFLQRAREGETTDKSWIETRPMDVVTAAGETRTVEVNAYFHDHPEMVLGEQNATGTMYGRPDAYNVVPRDGDLGAKIADAVSELPANVYASRERTVDVAADRDALVPENTKVYGYFLSGDGKTVMQRIPDAFDGSAQSTPVEFQDRTAPQRAAGMVGVKEALRNLMRAELSVDSTDTELSKMRNALNDAYDRFQRKFGFINAVANRRAFRDDPDLPLLESLEPEYDPGISKAVAKKREIEPRAPSAGKADIFRRRVLAPTAFVENVTSAKDAMVASLNVHGRIDPDYMASIYGKPFDEITDELGNLAFQDPESRSWETADVYLSGNVKHKLAVAKTAAQRDPEMARNVTALEAVQPQDVPAMKIGVRLGSPWIPGETIEEFARTLLGSGARPAVRYVRAIGRWSVEVVGADQSASISRWGTERVPAAAVMAAVMNNKQIVVKDNIGTSSKPIWVVNEPETEAARARAEEMAAKFKEWIWQDEERRNTLERIYNDGYNTNRRRTYDGSHLTLPGSSPAIELRQHQKNGVWRGIQEPALLLDHVVGAGKTYEMAAIAMELRRLGISRKPLFSVPNHLVRQWRDEIYKLYPNANVLAATEADFEKKNRKRLFARIATGDWDAIIVGHSSFQKIGSPSSAESEILLEQKKEIADAIEEAKRSRGDRNVLRDMERIKQNLDSRLKALGATSGAKDDVVDFEDLGIDALFVDEAHLFKNLFYMSQMRGIAGMGSPAGSGRAFDLFVKTQYLQRKFKDKARIVFATGTPISNSLVEMYTMQRYLTYPELKRRGIATLDAWAGVYGDVQNVYEVHPSGTGYRLKSRFAKFVNMPSLMELYRSFADVISLDDLKSQAKAENSRFPVPQVKGGKPQNIVANRSEIQTLFFGVPEFARDANGDIKFEYPADLTPELNGEGKWVLVGGASFKVNGEDRRTQFAGPFETEEDAKEQAALLVRKPVVGYNQGSILWKFENLRELTKSTNGKINALSVTNEARKAGLDYRLIDPSAGDFEGSKINLAVAEIKRIYDAWTDDRGTQLVFCDLSTPKSARAAAASREKPAYVRDRDGEIKRVKATVAAIEGQPTAFLIVRSRPGEFKAYDGISGADLGISAKTRDDTVSALTSKLARSSNWLENLRELHGEIDDDAIAQWKSKQDNPEDEGADDDDAITISDVIAMAGPGKFSVYDDVKAKLIRAGVPADEIAFIHDYDTAAKKNELFKAVRSGMIRILLGSTEKMGAGTNVQDRLVAEHHLDAPWRPSDLEQREGRIVRQGNELYARDPDGFAVEIIRYATQQTYDTRMWQLIEHKAAGIEQVRKADGSVFEIEDVGGEEANAADMKAAASGNPLILEEIKLRNEVKSLEAQQWAHQGAQISLQGRLKSARGAGARAEQRIAGFEPFMKAAADNPVAPFAFATPTGSIIEDKKDLAGPLNHAFAAAARSRNDIVVAGQYRGTRIMFERDEFGVHVTLNIGDSELDVVSYRKDDKFSPIGLITRIDNRLDRLEMRAAEMRREAADLEASIPGLEDEAKRPFAKSDALAKARADHRKVMNQLAKAGGGIDLTPAMRRELNRAIAKRTGTEIDIGDAKVSPAARMKPSMVRPSLSASSARAIAEDAYGADSIASVVRSGLLNFIDSYHGLSDVLQDYVDRWEAQNPGREVVALTDHTTGRIFIIADRAHASEVAGLVMHEIGEHYGLEPMIGAKNYRRLKDEVVAMKAAGNSPYVDGAWKFVETHYPSLQIGSDEFVREVIATVSENPEFRKASLWRRLKSWIRRFLFKIGFTGAWKLRDEDIGHMVSAALRRSMVPGTVATTEAGEVKASAAAGAAPVFYSQLADVIASKLPARGGARVYETMIQAWQRKGEFKKEELEWSGLVEWLKTQGKDLTRDDVIEYLRSNSIEINETVLGEGPTAGRFEAALAALEEAGYSAYEDGGVWHLEDSSGAAVSPESLPSSPRQSWATISATESGAASSEETRYGAYQIRGGENYRELLLTIPSKSKAWEVFGKDGFPVASFDTEAEAKADAERRGSSFDHGPRDSSDNPTMYRGNHWDEPNVIAHIRFNERTDADGKRVLFVEEVQSDWHQAGRKKGYGSKPIFGVFNSEGILDMTAPTRELAAKKARDGGYPESAVREVPGAHAGIPDAPFKQSWPMLVMKRMIRYAAENGFDRIAWTTGEQQAARYDLSKQIDSIVADAYDIAGETSWKLKVETVDGRDISPHSYIPEKDLPDYVGKELASKIIAEGGGEYSGLDLKIGGEGMQAFYDRELVASVNRYVKKWGAKVGTTDIDVTDAASSRFGSAMLGRTDQAGRTETATVHSVDVTPEMKAAAVKPQPMFAVREKSRQETVEDDAWRKAGLPREERPVSARIEGWAQKRAAEIKSEFLDNFETGMFDRFKPIKDAEGSVDPSRSGYISARLSTGSNSVLYASMLYGAPEMSNGLIQKKAGSRGLLEILKPVSGDLNRWAAWMVGKRADMLADQHRENNLTLEEIAYLKSLAGDNEETYEAVAKDVRAFLTDVLRLMETAGLLTADQVEAFDRDAYYLPFFRIDENAGDGDANRKFDPAAVIRPFTRRGLSHQTSGIKQLKGGVQALNDPIENLFSHLSHAIDASMKNYALARTIANASRQMTVAKEGDRARAVRVMWKGRPYWFNVEDPALLRALTAIGEKPRTGYAINVGRSMRRLLTTGVTLDPAFMLRNFVRDTTHSWIIDKNSMRFGIDALKGAKATLKSVRAEATGDVDKADPAMVSMMFAGASFVGGHVYGTDPKSNAAALRKALRRRGYSEDKVKSYLDSMVTTSKKFASLYIEIGEAMENANRLAVFKAAQDSGKSLHEALFDSKDLMDFSLRGQWTMVQVMSDVLPFFNARLQGLYKLGREARRDPRVLGLVATRIAARGAVMALAATALVAAYSGDDRYEELEEWDKDANWHFWVNGVHYRIPKPFELGIVFGTIPERIYRLAAGYDRFGETVQSMTHGITTTLEFNPIPQAVRPAAEIYFNFDLFRQRPIETMSDQAKLPQDRYTAMTSPTMAEIGRATGVSPKKIEYAWNGYLGTVGTYFLGIVDMLVKNVRGDVEPTWRIEDYPIIGSFVRTGPAWSTEYQTELYEMLREAEQTHRSIRDKFRSGEENAADRLLDEKAALLDVRKTLRRTATRLSTLRKRRDVVMRDPEMSPAQKRAELDQIQIEINDAARETMTSPEVMAAQ